MDATQQQALRGKLESQLKQLQSLEQDSAQSRAPVQLDQQSVGRVSRIDAMQQQAMAQASNLRRQQEIRDIQAALLRMDQDDFGFCEHCGDEIPLARLNLYPTSRYCVDCAEKQES